MTAVTITDAERRTRYQPSVPADKFGVVFPIFDDADVAVFIDGAEAESGDGTFGWSISSSYTIGTSSDAAVVPDDPVAWIGHVIDIVGRRRPRRVDQFIDGRGIPARDQNLILNAIVAQAREAFDALAGALRAIPGETIGALPSAADRAHAILAFDDAGNVTVRTDLIGDKGWSPVLAVVEDSARRVFQIVDWTGGEGDKPATGYLSATGIVASLAAATDVRGPQGTSGAGTGDMVAANNLHDVSSVSSARGNLGLGTAAIKDVGTSANNVVQLDGSGKLPALDGSQLTGVPNAIPPVGIVVPYAGAAAPTNWLLCYGQAVSRATYSVLFGIIGTAYGGGDGSTTFNLPDLRGRISAGKDDMGGSAAGRLSGTTITSGATTLGHSGGEQTHTLTTPEIPAHTHTQAAAGLASPNIAVGSGSFGSASGPTGSTGGGGAHNNVQPTLILNYIIFAAA